MGCVSSHPKEPAGKTAQKYLADDTPAVTTVISNNTDGKTSISPSKHQEGEELLSQQAHQESDFSYILAAAEPTSTVVPENGACQAPGDVPDSPPPLAKAPSKPISKLRTDVKIRDMYKLGKTVGTGGFSVVKVAVEKQTGKEYACKIMALPPVGEEVGDNENTREDIFKEIDILCGLNHENVVFLKEYYQEDDNVYLITELLMGGELLESVLRHGSYGESDARNCFRQLLQGIAYLHSRNVVHRDLKLENLLLASSDNITRVKIADFGLAKKSAGHGMQTICGTPQYVAPEVINGQKGLEYGPGVDMWSAGVVLFILLGGYPPFWSESEPQLFEQIRRGRFAFADPVWNNISDSAKDLISKLLVVDPVQRLSATQALQHPWFACGDEQHVSPSGPPLTATQQNMKRHFPSSKFKATVGTIIAANRVAQVLHDVRNRRNSGRPTCESEKVEPSKSEKVEPSKSERVEPSS